MKTAKELLDEIKAREEAERLRQDGLVRVPVEAMMARIYKAIKRGQEHPTTPPDWRP